MIVNLLAPHGATAQNLALLLALLIVFTLGYAVRDTRQARRDRRRRRRERWVAEHNYAQARRAVDPNLTAPKQEVASVAYLTRAAPGRSASTAYLTRVAPDCSAGAA